jgi:hypothetical protein
MTYSGACTLPVPKIGDRPLEIMPVIHTHRHRYERGTHPPATWRERTAAAPAARQSADACFLAHSGAAARRAVPCRRRRFARLWRQLGAARRAGQLEQFLPRDAVASCAGADSGSLMTRRWRKMDSNPRSPVAGRGQAARNQIFRTTTGAEAYVRRNKAADRLMRRAPDQPSRNLPPPPFLFRHRRARRGA